MGPKNYSFSDYSKMIHLSCTLLIYAKLQMMFAIKGNQKQPLYFYKSKVAYNRLELS